jgi:SAM-dependent methyltransferase
VRVTSGASGRERRFDRIKPALVCPRCRGDLQFDAHAASCTPCQARFPIRNHQIFFIDVPPQDDELDRIKAWLKRRLGTAYYSVGVTMFAPTFPLNFARRIRRHLDPAATLVVDAGSGNNRLHPDIICVDLVDYESVDVVCTLDALPFRTGSVDAFVSRSVLEHVVSPAAVVAEFHRCTRVGGFGIHVIPFLYPFHASPSDFHRFTHRGHELLFARWSTVARTNPTGPVTVGLVHFFETVATLLSFGSASMKAFAYLALCAILFPVKFLDAPFVGRTAFMGCAASLLSVVRKTAD